MFSLIEDTGLTEVQSELIQSASGSASTLLSIVNNILDFFKTDSGSVVLEKIPFSITTLVQDTCRAMQPLGKQKGLDINSTDLTPLVEDVIGDPLRIRQM